MIDEKEVAKCFKRCGGTVHKSALGRAYFEYERKIFLSLNEFASYYNINYYVFLRKIAKGIKLSSIINGVRDIVDHNGVKYPTMKAMCEHYGISSSLYISRINRNWSLKDALEKKPS